MWAHVANHLADAPAKVLTATTLTASKSRKQASFGKPVTIDAAKNLSYNSSSTYVFYSKHSTTMAWRSSGDTNEELVRNLKRKSLPALFCADSSLLVSDRALDQKFLACSQRNSSLIADRMTYASGIWLFVWERFHVDGDALLLKLQRNISLYHCTWNVCEAIVLVPFFVIGIESPTPVLRILVLIHTSSHIL